MKNWDELAQRGGRSLDGGFCGMWRIPGGESYLDLQERVNRCWNRIREHSIAPSTFPAPGEKGRSSSADGGVTGGDRGRCTWGALIRQYPFSGITGLRP